MTDEADRATAPEARLGLVVGSSLAASELWPLEPTTVPTSTVEVEVLLGEGLAVLARHGTRAHRLPHQVDHHANLEALATVGVDRIVALGSTGSLRADWPVGTLVAPDDLFAPWVNPTWHDDVRDHVTPGFDEAWRARVVACWPAAGDQVLLDGGTYVQTRGPRFESPAEVRFYAGVGDIVGMTLVDETVRAQQAGLAHAAICVVDNLANGIGGTLSMADFEAGVAANAERLRASVRELVANLLADG